jgi:hypothetical protein
MTDAIPPVIYLRQLTISKTQPKLTKSDGTPTADLRDAQYAHINPSAPNFGPAVSIDAKAGYKEYTIQTLIYFIQNRDLEQAAYLQASLAYWSGTNMDVPSVSFIDRRDLLEYLTGASDSSVWVKSAAVIPGLTGQALPVAQTDGVTDGEFLVAFCMCSLGKVGIHNVSDWERTG